MTYNSKLFVSRIVTESHYCLLRIIITYLKPFNCVQTNDYYQIEKSYLKLYNYLY